MNLYVEFHRLCASYFSWILFLIYPGKKDGQNFILPKLFKFSSTLGLSSKYKNRNVSPLFFGQYEYFCWILVLVFARIFHGYNFLFIIGRNTCKPFCTLHFSKLPEPIYKPLHTSVRDCTAEKAQDYYIRIKYQNLLINETMFFWPMEEDLDAWKKQLFYKSFEGTIHKRGFTVTIHISWKKLFVNLDT